MKNLSSQRHILFISEYFPPYKVKGGAEISTSLQCEALPDNYKKYVMVGKNNPNKWEYAGAEVFDGLILPDDDEYQSDFFYIKWFHLLFYGVMNMCKIFSAYIKTRPDLIQIEPSNFFSFPSVLISLILPVPTVVDVRNHVFSVKSLRKFNWLKLDIWYEWLSFFIGRSFILMAIKVNKNVKFVALSKYMKSELIKSGIDESVIEVIYNAGPKHKEPKRIRNNQIIFAGRLSTNKGVLVLLDAFKYLHDEVILVIYGEGELLSEVEKFVKLYPKRIIYKGKKPYSEVKESIKNAKGIVAPSIWEEPFGRFIQDSYAYSTPVVASKIGGIVEGINNYKNGILVKPNDSIALANGINNLFDKELHSRFTRNLKKENTKFSKNKINCERIELYNYLLN